MARQKGTTEKTVQSTKEVKEDKKPKNFVIRRKEGTSLFIVGYENGGEVPKKLQGLYTSDKVAAEAIESYQLSR